MRNKAIIILIIVVMAVGSIATIFLIGGFQFGNESITDAFSIKSNDESAELIIPKDTLPDDVNIEDIFVTRILNDQLDDGELIVYELEPDGLEFTQEITLKVQLESDNNTVPIVFISTRTGIDLVNNTQTEVDLETKKQNVSIPITHFSEVGIFNRHGTSRITASAQDCRVGEKVLTTASFTLYKDRILIKSRLLGAEYRIYVFEFLEPRVSIEGVWHNYGHNGVTPAGRFGDKPDLTDVPVGQTVTYPDDTFTCNEPGNKVLLYTLTIITNMKMFVYNSEEDYLAGRIAASRTRLNDYHLAWVNVPFTCTSEVVEEDPKTDPGSDPKAEMSYNLTYNSQGYIVNTKIFVDIEAYPGSNGTVTLSGPNMLPIIEKVNIDESGQTRLTFIVYHFGKYTALVEMGGFTIDKQIWT